MWRRICAIGAGERREVRIGEVVLKQARLSSQLPLTGWTTTYLLNLPLCNPANAPELELRASPRVVN